MNNNITVRPEIIFDAISRYKFNHDEISRKWMKEQVTKIQVSELDRWFRKPRSYKEIEHDIKLNCSIYFYYTVELYPIEIVKLNELVKIAIEEHVLITITQESVNLLYEYLIHE